MAEISHPVLTQFHNALADATTGFNARCALLAPTYGVQAISIDFTLPGSKSFAIANIDPVQLLEQVGRKAPLMVLYSKGFRSQQETNRVPFEGFVPVFADIVFGFKSDTIFGNLELTGSMIEDVMSRILYETEWAPPVYQVADYSGDRTSLETGDKYWLQRLKFQVTFRVWH